jgi:hypothetical protein
LSFVQSVTTRGLDVSRDSLDKWHFPTAARYPEMALVTRPLAPFDAGADGTRDFYQLSAFHFELL